MSEGEPWVSRGQLREGIIPDFPSTMSPRERLGHIREAKGVSSERMAELLRMNHEDYERYESGNEPIPDEDMPALSVSLLIVNRYLRECLGMSVGTPFYACDAGIIIFNQSQLTPADREFINQRISQGFNPQN